MPTFSVTSSVTGEDSPFLFSVDFPARIPEHSPALMAVASGGRPLRVGEYLFFHAGERLIGIGYALTGGTSPAAFEAAFREAKRRTGARIFHLMSPRLPASLRGHTTETDRYYVLSAQAPVPARLRAPLERARAALRLEDGREFTPAHRRLWGEFLGRASLPPSVRALYGRVEELLRDERCRVRLLNALDADGHLAACLVMDEAPAHFDTYLLGAHSREHATPYATDALFALMLERARRRGKRFIHLGLGVNAGISRFKRKWGGRPALRYVRADWEEPKRDEAFLLALLESMHTDPDAAWREAQREMEHAQVQRPFRMLWKVEKNGRTSWLGGTAHFFPYSFESAFKRLFREVDTVLFEGHLDEDSLETVARAGKRPPAPGACLHDLLTPAERAALARVVRGPEGPFWRALNMEVLARPQHGSGGQGRCGLVPAPDAPVVRLLFPLVRLSGTARLAVFRRSGSLAHGPRHGQARARHGRPLRADRRAGKRAPRAGRGAFPGLRTVGRLPAGQCAHLSGR